MLSSLTLVLGKQTMRVVELFAGVGGFRIGFEGPPNNSKRERFRVVWSNQWEPSTKKQHAAEIYVSQWNLKRSEQDSDVYTNGIDDVFVNKDITQISASEIPDHEILCGGFPCQDYSVAKTANKATGLEGKKGVLWWDIHRIIKEKKPIFALLENVDRLQKSPTTQRGRDFAVMLASLDDLGYMVEWRSFAASEYGMPQRRSRVYILAYRRDKHSQIVESMESRYVSPEEWIRNDGILAKSFPIKDFTTFGLPSFPLRSKSSDDLADISINFNDRGDGIKRKSPFMDAGLMIDGMVFNTDYKPDYHGDRTLLGDVLIQPRYVPDEFIIPAYDLIREKGWIYLKGAKKEKRIRGTFEYNYSEGPVGFPDSLIKPSRTIITGEGGAGPSRFKHVVVFKPTKKQIKNLELNSTMSNDVRGRLKLKKSEWLRRLTPVELERLNMFPDNHTLGVTDGKRAFIMGNGLVTGVISSIANQLPQISNGPNIS